MADESARSPQRVPVGGGDAMQRHEPVDLYRLLLEVSRLAASRRDLDGLLGELVVVLQKAMRFDGLAVVLHDASRREMVLRFAGGSALQAKEVVTRLEADAAGLAWLTQQPIFVPDVERETRFPEIIEVARSYGMRSFCVFPLNRAAVTRAADQEGRGSFAAGRARLRRERASQRKWRSTMKPSHLVPTLLVTVTLAGCSAIAEPRGILGALDRLKVGPDYERPATQLPDRFRGQPNSGDPASIADLPWWDVFGDPALQQLIREALENNDDLEVAIARVAQFRARVGVAASELYPQVGYDGSAAREKVFLPVVESGGNRTTNVFSGVLAVAWEIDVWGRIRRATEAARAEFLASEDARRGVMLSLVSDVAAGYFRLLELDRQREIARSSAETYQRTLDLFTQRYEGGTDTQLSTSRAEAALAESLATIARLDQAIVQQENAISELLGAPPRPIERGNSLTAQSPPAAPAGLTADLLQRRPDILRTEHEMMSANAEIGVAVANFFPRIGLSTLYGGESAEIGNVIKNNFSVWNIVGSVSGPIFQGGRLIEQYRARQAFWDETIASYRGTIMQALREVSDALVAQAKLVERRAAEERQVKALALAVELSLDRYRAGLANYYEVLEAEQQLYPAEDALAQSQRDQLLTVVTLYKALGGGWNLPDDTWTAMR